MNLKRFFIKLLPGFFSSFITFFSLQASTNETTWEAIPNSIAAKILSYECDLDIFKTVSKRSYRQAWMSAVYYSRIPSAQYKWGEELLRNREEEKKKKGRKLILNAIQNGYVLNFDKLPCEKELLDRYTILCLDRSLMKSKDDEQEEWYKKFLNPNLFSENTAWNKEPEQKTNAILVTKHQTFKLIKGNKKFLVVELKKKKNNVGSANITNFALKKEFLKQEEDFIYSASLLLFYDEKNSDGKNPQDKIYPYVFGHWQGLINSSYIISDWGLRLIASHSLYDEKIKEIKRRDFRHSNPASRTEKRDKPAGLKQFTIDIGSEGIESLRMITKLSKFHIFKGDDIFHFQLAKTNKKEIEKGITFHSLERIHLFFSFMNQNIHSEFLPYMDGIIEDKNITDPLDKLAYGFFEDEKKYSGNFFVHENIWKAYGKKPTFSLDEENWHTDFLKALVRYEFSFEDTFFIKKYRQKGITTAHIGRFLFSIPLAYEDCFYRFDRGYWFRVDDSRFRLIREILRKRKIFYKDLEIPTYNEESLKTQEGNYKEDKFNRFCVKEMNSKGLKALLLDRDNIALEGNGGTNKFEFADILLLKKENNIENIYLIHVKRAKALLSHLIEQLGRCAQYLGTNLDRTNGKKLIDSKEFKSIKNVLFSKKVLTSEIKKKITFVLTMVDDKQSREALFKPQDLWGVDRLRQLIEQLGFNFAITIVNETKLKEGIDCFGPLPSPTIEIKAKTSSKRKNEVEKKGSNNINTSKKNKKK